MTILDAGLIPPQPTSDPIGKLIQLHTKKKLKYFFWLQKKLYNNIARLVFTKIYGFILLIVYWKNAGGASSKISFDYEKYVYNDLGR